MFSVLLPQTEFRLRWVRASQLRNKYGNFFTLFPTLTTIAIVVCPFAIFLSFFLRVFAPRMRFLHLLILFPKSILIASLFFSVTAVSLTINSLGIIFTNNRHLLKKCIHRLYQYFCSIPLFACFWRRCFLLPNSYDRLQVKCVL